MKGLYIADYFEGSGFGHVTRFQSYCTLLQDIEITLATQKIFYKNKHHNICIPKDTASFIELLKKFDFAICDSFCLDSEKIAILENLEKIIFIDDYIRRDFTNGLIIDGTVGCEEYRKPTGTQTAYGLNYSIVRQEFYNDDLQKIESDLPLVCTFGGHDPRNYLQLFYEELPNDTVFIGTSAYPAYKAFRGSERILWNLDATGMAKVLARSRFVLATAGQTLYELAALNKAFLSIVFTDNHKEDGLGFTRYGCHCVQDAGDKLKLLSSVMRAISTVEKTDIHLPTMNTSQLKHIVCDYLKR